MVQKSGLSDEVPQTHEGLRLYIAAATKEFNEARNHLNRIRRLLNIARKRLDPTYREDKRE